MFNLAKFSTSPFSLSPFRTGPTPAGVPVKIKSPGRNSKKPERAEITSSTVQIISEISPSCLSSPLTYRVIFPRSMCPTSLTGCKAEQGAELSKPFAVAQGRPFFFA